MSPAIMDLPVVRRNDMAVKIDAEVVAEAKMVAASRNQSLAEYLSELLRPFVHADLVGETGRRLGPTGRPAPPKKGPPK